MISEEKTELDNVVAQRTWMRSFSSEMESPPESVDYFTAGITEKDQGSKVGQVADEHQSLPQHLKRLFLYCSLFPSGYEFSKDELIQLWIAEGFIRQRQNQRMEDTASEHFNSLEKEGFFLLSRCDFTSVLSNPTGNFLYRVNPIKHSILGDTISSGNYFRAVDGKLDGASEMTRHLSLLCEDIGGMTFGILQNFKHLRTLHLLSCRGSFLKHVPRDFCFTLTFLRTLNLSGTLISELPSSIGNVKSLRYIDASHTPISRLPESIDSLHKLQTIKLRGCIHFVQLPKGMKKLTNLRHIDLDIIRQLDSMPAHLGNLSNLQTLPAFLVGRDDGCHVGELKNLKDLTGAFNISRLENVLSKEEAEKAALIDKKRIHSLELRWSNLFVEYAEQQEKVLECLQPHSGLKELQIQQYGGSILPTWISNPSFADLVVITLYRCRNCKLLPCMGQLPALKSLSIIEVNEVKDINHQFFRNGPVNHAFPKLERLQVDIMLNLKEWKDVQLGDLPSLVELTVDSCPELVAIPPLSCLKSLKHLEFRRCPKLLSLPPDGLPTSLESFLLLDCLELKEWCLNSEHWSMLCHVPSVWFDNEEVETIMELWNKDDDFRKEYIKCNTRSTLRRLRTLDGRSLGPDEEPPVIPDIVRVTRHNMAVAVVPTPEPEKQVASGESDLTNGRCSVQDNGGGGLHLELKGEVGESGGVVVVDKPQSDSLNKAAAEESTHPSDPEIALEKNAHLQSEEDQQLAKEVPVEDTWTDLVQDSEHDSLTSQADTKLDKEIVGGPDSKENGDGLLACDAPEVQSTCAERCRAIAADDGDASESRLLNDSSVENGRLNCISDDVKTESDVKSTPQEEEVECTDGIHRSEASTSWQEVPTVVSLEQQDKVVEVEKRPFYFLIRIPRNDDENLKEQIKHAQLLVEEKTRGRDAIRSKMQMQRATCKEYQLKFEAAISEERAAQELLKSKRREMDSVQFMINKVKDAQSVEEMANTIRHMEHTMAHETLPLKEEKQYISDIKQLKQRRDQLSYSLGKQDEVQQTLDQKVHIEERIKDLRKEMDQLRATLLKAQEVTQADRKKFSAENDMLHELQYRFEAADATRQEAYVHLQSLRKQNYEKTKHFWRYKNDAKAANDLALSGDKEQLQHLCINQVETIMELWNKDDDFRKEYIKCNTRSTLRRLRTLDGRSLGPDEEPPVIPDIVRVTRHNMAVAVVPTPEPEKQVAIVESEEPNDKSAMEIVEQTNEIAKNKKPVKVASYGISQATTSGRNEIEEEKVEDPKPTKEEEELARKEEELRKEEAAARLRKQRRLEEKAKAKEAMERMQGKREKAQARAAIKAQKEAEEKEKETEKRVRKKERKKETATKATNGISEGESAPEPSPETTSVTPLESEAKEKPMTITKRSQKAPQFTKQTKVKSIPLPLRNRSKRRMQPWLWVLVTVVAILGLFLLGNGGSFSFKSMQWKGNGSGWILHIHTRTRE